ncbi:MAG: amidohydrolase family protein [Woeseiaceae bacterium]|nr:amidohydrolase family protein [Woeseiaceae bacterium]NIP21459.1 amidohydrolase family protein [Woeseiaceae bacterium]NIS90447.1 amidohydrolase family protein [Woeseiaceae bacterium]
MRRALLLATIFLTVGAASAAPTAFLNVNVIPMTEETVLEAQTVIVEGGRITLVGDVDSIPVPEGAIVVDGTDRYLMPGLTEMHAHVPDIGSQELERVLTLFVANGVTTARGMLGRPSHLVLRQQLLDGERFGPTLITSGPSLNGNSVNGPEDGERQVRAQHAAGYDFIKIHPGLTSGEFYAIADVANELGIPFAGHVTSAVGVEGALNAGMATIDHLDGYVAALMPADVDPSGGYGGFFGVLLADQVDEEKIAGIVAQTVAAGTWNVPTQSLIEQLVNDQSVADLASRPENRYMLRRTVQQWASAKERQLNERGFSPAIGQKAIELRRQIIRALHEAGAGLLLGSDAPQIFNVPGFSLHHELAFLVAAGLTPFEALETGTAAVAEFFGSNGGYVAAGKDADLVLLDANPLDDISHSRRVYGVMVRGQWFDYQELHERLSRFESLDD